MTIQQVVAKLREEKQNAVSSRFPCRAIMVNNVEQYKSLISELQQIGDVEIVPSVDLFSSADVMPRYENLKDPKYQNRWIILTGVSEYLRLFSKSEAATQRFAKLWSYQAPASSTGRVLIPLWGCGSQWRDKSLHLCEDLRQQEFYMDCSDSDSSEQSMNILVLSGAFEQYMDSLSRTQGQVIFGLQDWFEYWASPSSLVTDYVLLTKRLNGIQPTTGNISIKVIQDTLSFIQMNLKDGEILTKSNCPDTAASLLFGPALNDMSVDQAILTALNIITITSLDIAGKWKNMRDGEKHLVKLWYSLHPDDSYFCHCINTCKHICEIPEHILMDIFIQRNMHPSWVQESQRLIETLNITKTSTFFAELDKIPVYEERLHYLSGSSKEERIYLLHMIGKWMREDEVQVLSCERLKQVYPEIYAYLNHDHAALDMDIRRYFSLYKAYKLENALPADEDLYFSDIQTDTYDYRYAMLHNALDDDCIILWVDALGVEWLPLLTWTLMQNDNSIVKNVTVTQATLPSETSFNEQWHQMDVPYAKLDKLDKLAHKGVIDDPDYYSCMEDQISFVANLRNVVSELLSEHHRVIITGDHGTSRLAARFFHEREGLPVPSGATVFSHGRYCQLAGSNTSTYLNMRDIKSPSGSRYLVCSNYDHFTQSGFATSTSDDNATYGEIHGGATPEEVLVPVIVVDSKLSNPLKADWQKNPVKIMAKKVKAALNFNRPVQALQVKIGAIEGICIPNADKKQWAITFAGVTAGTYPVAITADNTSVGVIPLVVKSALGDGDGDLPL